jgi:hypothetical protein
MKCRMSRSTFLLGVGGAAALAARASPSGNAGVGEPSGALADNLGERCRRADNVGVGDDVEQGDGVGG